MSRADERRERVVRLFRLTAAVGWVLNVARWVNDGHVQIGSLPWLAASVVCFAVSFRLSHAARLRSAR